ncbi:MAG: T9SS type A sorting domain-containing protein, partial [Bacteroidota bacterium]
DDFYQTFGLPAKITEFDLPTNMVDTVAAAYLEDFLTAIFSHPSVDGFLFWNFWDGSTWRAEGSNIFNLDWSMTLPGSTFIELVFDAWWTEEQLATDANGEASMRGFKGLYELSYTCDGVLVKDTINLTEDLSITIQCDQLATGIRDPEEPQVKVFPNPATDLLTIESALPGMSVAIYDLQGRELLTQVLSQSQTSVDLSFLTRGLYVMVISGAGQAYREMLRLE